MALTLDPTDLGARHRLQYVDAARQQARQTVRLVTFASGDGPRTWSVDGDRMMTSWWWVADVTC
jgi:hypothetical protein